MSAAAFSRETTKRLWELAYQAGPMPSATERKLLDLAVRLCPDCFRTLANGTRHGTTAQRFEALKLAKIASEFFDEQERAQIEDLKEAHRKALDARRASTVVYLPSPRQSPPAEPVSLWAKLFRRSRKPARFGSRVA